MKKLDILLLGKYVKKKAHRSSIYNFLKKSHNITFVDEFQKIKFKTYDIAICYGYGKILTKEQIIKINCKIINLHIGYLPFARGIYPLLWSLIFFKPIGFSIHLISNESIDDGPILIKKKIAIKKTDNLEKIHLNCRKAIDNYFFHNFEEILNYKTKKLNLLKAPKKYYFSRKLSKKLMFKLPLKWSTSAEYLMGNSKNLKKIYEEC
tara:strand:+ start:395 stop:1015 length:621 start_codon:yes stop_codon:yes gene_type:complete